MIQVNCAAAKLIVTGEAFYALFAGYYYVEEINVLANIAESLNNIETKLVAEETISDS